MQFESTNLNSLFWICNQKSLDQVLSLLHLLEIAFYPHFWESKLTRQNIFV